MSLATFSTFYYGFTVTDENKYISFAEGGPELIGEIEVGDWTASELQIKIKTALDIAGANVYTVSFDRATRLFTISTTVNFSLLVASGTSGASIFGLIGFTGADRLMAGTYTGNAAAGDIYNPQFIIQDHISSDNFQKLVNPSINKTASGRVEVIRFGTEKFIQCNFKFITNEAQDGKVIKNNPTGVEDLQRFMQFLIQKKPVEFMKDSAVRSNFQKVLLESFPNASDGTGYQLRELYDRGLPNYFETGIFTFRVLEN
jgi:hypothetical protein